MLTVVHGKAKDPLVTQIKRRVDAEIFNVTFSNREDLTKQLPNKVFELMLT
jgi:nucleoside-triphosphatase THEP1